MSDTTNLKKGVRSGVQKLIKEEKPNTYDVGCIYHLADLTVKAGMESLPVNIDQLLWIFSTIFCIVVRGGMSSSIFGARCSLLSLNIF